MIRRLLLLGLMKAMIRKLLLLGLMPAMVRKLLLLSLMTAAIPLVVGCDEKVKGDDSAKSETKAGADKPAPTDTGKKPKPSADLGDFSTADPLIINAIQSRQQLAVQEEELLDRLDEVRKLLASAKADPARIRQSIEEFLALVKEIRVIVANSSRSLVQLDDSTRELGVSLKHLGNSYRAAAGLFRLKARDYSEKRLRDQLNGFADDFEAIGKTIPERAKSLQAFHKTLPSIKTKIREANAFLDDTVLFLSSHPGVGADPRERYSAQFEAFVVTFSGLLRTLDEFRTTFREQALSKAIQDAHKKDTHVLRIEQERKEELAKAEREKVEIAARLKTDRREEATRFEAEEQMQTKASADRDSSTSRDENIAPLPIPAASTTWVAGSSSQPFASSIVLSNGSCCPQIIVIRSSPCQGRLLPIFQRGQ